MKNLNFILLIASLIFFQSYNGQNLDLEKLILPADPLELKNLDLANSGAGIGDESVQYSSYFTDDVQFLNFAGIPIKNEMNTNTYSGSVIRFYNKNDAESFQGYTLNIKNPESFAKILGYFLAHKNKFKLVYDNGKDHEERARIFNCQENKTVYLVLSIYNNGKASGYIDAVNDQEISLLNSRLGGTFGYYKEYLNYRKRKSTDSSYLDFIKEPGNDLYKESNNLK